MIKENKKLKKRKRTETENCTKKNWGGGGKSKLSNRKIIK